MNRLMLASAAALPLLAACAATPPAPAAAPAEAFLAAFAPHCGKAYAGGLVTNEAPDADMVGAAMVMHVRECAPGMVKIPFHIQRADGTWDRSRTWIITRTDGGLRLRHDHRRPDGSEDDRTQYGGVTTTPGSAGRQIFPIDAETIRAYDQAGLVIAKTNIWGVEISPAAYAYELRRYGENARNFRVEFDLTRPIAPPPPPWGSE